MYEVSEGGVDCAWGNGCGGVLRVGAGISISVRLGRRKLGDGAVEVEWSM